LINNNLVTDVILKLKKNKKLITSKSISVNLEVPKNIPSKIILQMLGSGLVVYSKNLGIPDEIKILFRSLLTIFYSCSPENDGGINQR